MNTRATSPSEKPRKTYSERIAEERAKEKAKVERQKLIEKSRSTSFNFGEPVASSFNAGGNGIAPAPSPHPIPGTVSRFRQPPGLAMAHESDPFISASTAATTPPTESESTDSAGFDTFSSLHLSSRLIPHPTLSRHLAPKTIYLLPTLLKVVVAPEFEPPDVEGDWVVMGIICSKSEPREVGQNTGYKRKEGGSGKYMVMQLTDLKWEIELFLFGSGFDKFWKVPVGTIVAILNPGVMKPRNADTGRFSLTLNDDSDTLLEVGRSRDLAFCKSVKRDGKQCQQWVDKRHTHYCGFHIEQGVKKARVGRAEVNSMSKLYSPPKKGQLRPKRFFGKGAGGGGGGGAGRDGGLLHEGPITDLPQRAGGAGGKVFVAPGRSAKSLLDDDGYLGDAFHRGSREERLQKRLAASEKEREVTRRIIESQGREGGVGVDYLKLGVDRYDIGQRKEKEGAKGTQGDRVRWSLVFVYDFFLC